MLVYGDYRPDKRAKYQENINARKKNILETKLDRSEGEIENKV